MNDSIIAFIDRILAEYDKSKQIGLAQALTIFYSGVLTDPKFEKQRRYCEKKMQESANAFFRTFCEVVFKS